jgi:hypothetical protein
MRLLEKRRGKVFHKSRSTLTQIDSMTPDDKAIVLQAIWTYTDEKYIPSINRQLHSQVMGVKQNKAAMLNEILGN